MTATKIEIRGCDSEVVAVGKVVGTETRENGQKVLIIEFTPTLRTRLAANIKGEEMNQALRELIGDALRDLGDRISHG